MNTTRIRTLLVDDERLARRGLELRLAAAPDVDIVGECENGREALEKVAQLKPDLMFLDIQMPGLSGFDVLAQLPHDAMPVVVFVTAFDRYAIDAFEARALDYLLKPVEDTRLEQALNRVREHLKTREQVQQHEPHGDRRQHERQRHDRHHGRREHRRTSRQPPAERNRGYGVDRRRGRRDAHADPGGVEQGRAQCRGSDGAHGAVVGERRLAIGSAPGMGAAQCKDRRGAASCRGRRTDDSSG